MRNSSFRFQHLKLYGFISINIKHYLYHNTIKGIIGLAGSRVFVQKSKCYRFCELKYLVSKDSRFSNSLNASSTDPKTMSKSLWREVVASKWGKDSNALNSSKILLDSNDPSFVEVIKLNFNSDQALNNS